MRWVILTENQEKANAFRKSLPETPCLSTRGLLWEPTVEISGQTISYKKTLKKDCADLLQKILQQANKADITLLAFEQTRIGEAIAWEFEQLIGKDKCCRWPLTTLDRKSVHTFFHQMETTAAIHMPKCFPPLAKSYWCQSTLDITWSNKTSQWLKETHHIPDKITPTQISILHDLWEHTQLRETYKKQKYYEIHITLSSKQGKKILTKAIHPSSLIVDTLPPETKKIWKTKITQYSLDLLEGTHLPNPKSPKAQRFSSEENANKYKNHVRKYPFFLVSQQLEQKPDPSQILEPFNYNSLIEYANQEGHTNTEANQKALQELYYEGYISYYKTEVSELSPQTLEKLLQYTKKKGLQIQYTPQNTSLSKQEGLHPCEWEKTRKELDVLLPENELKTTKIWMYQTIRDRCIKTLQNNPTKTLLFHFYGPMPLSKQASLKKTGQAIQIKKEQKLLAPFSLILAGTLPLEEVAPFKEGEILEAIEFKVIPKETSPPVSPQKNQLIASLAQKGKLKPETLEIALNNLIQKNLLKSDPLILTPKGLALHHEILHIAGLFLDPQFQISLQDLLLQIESGKKNEDELLQEWWPHLKTLLS